MQKIPLSLADGTMCSAKNILLHDGSCAVRKGDALDATALHRIDALGMTHVVVEGAPLEGYDMGYDAQAVASRLPFLFRNFAGNESMMRLSTVLARLLAARSTL